MMLAGIFGLIVWIAVALVFGFVLGATFRFLLRPLAIPKSAGIEYKRERFLSYLLFASFAASTLAFVILGVTYLIGFLRHLRRNSASAGSDRPDTSRIIPRFVLSELLVMVFGLGLLPLVVQALLWTDNKTVAGTALYGGMAVFPACYLCVLYRLNFHKIPSGLRRSFLVVLTPYCALSVVSIAVALIVLLFSGFINLEPQFFVWIAASVSITIATRITASQLVDEAKEAEIRAYVAPTAPPPAPASESPSPPQPPAATSL